MAVFDDKNGSKISKVARKIDGKPVKIEQVREFAHIPSIKKVIFISLLLFRLLKVYQVSDPEDVGSSITDLIVTKIVTKDMIV